MSVVRGRLVLDDHVATGSVTIADGVIADVSLGHGVGAAADAPYLAPGFVDVHVHGWGGHDAMGDAAALDGMARALLRRGVTSFLPTAVSAPLPALVEFAARVRAWMREAPADGAEPLGVRVGDQRQSQRRGAGSRCGCQRRAAEVAGNREIGCREAGVDEMSTPGSLYQEATGSPGVSPQG